MKFNKLFFFGFLTLLISEYCYARAGGATSHSSGGRSNYGGFIELLYFIGIAVWAVILGFIVYLKKRKHEGYYESSLWLIQHGMNII